MLAGPPLKTRDSPFASSTSLNADICSQYIPMRSRPAIKAPKIWEKMKYGTFFHGKPCQIAKHIVTAGLK